MSVILDPSSGRGRELCQMLRRELGVPKEVRWFEVRFAVNECVTVRCEYMPAIDEPPADDGPRKD